MSRRGVAWVMLVLATSLVGACASTDAGDEAVLRWWTVPDRTPAASLAQACGGETGVPIEVETLPADVDRRRVELIRRFAAHDDTIDILSLDTSLTAEMAAAGYLRTVPADVAESFGSDAWKAAAKTVRFDGDLVALPWWLDPQLLWFRGAAAERAGIDTTEPVTWDDLLAGAARIGATVQINDPTGGGLGDWVNALIAGAGGTLVDGTGRDAAIGLDTAAGRLAAGIVQKYAEAGLGPGPAPDAPTAFASSTGGFLLAGPSVITDPALATVVTDMRSMRYPLVDTDDVAPLRGVSLAVPTDAPDPDAAFAAITCLTSTEAMKTMTLASGHASARPSTLDDEQVAATFTTTDQVKASLRTGITAPATPYWQRVRAGLRDSWLPVSSVSPTTTPDTSDRLVTDLVGGGLR